MVKRAARKLLACWGNGDFGRLGHGAACLSEELPRVVSSLADCTLTAVACGSAHTAVLGGILRLSNGWKMKDNVVLRATSPQPDITHSVINSSS